MSDFDKSVPYNKKTNFKLGEAISEDAYDENGTLLLSAGKTVEEIHWMQILEERSANLKLHCKSDQKNIPQESTQKAEDQVDHQSVIIENYDKVRRSAVAARSEATKAVVSVFDRITTDKRVAIDEIKSTVSPIISSIVVDPRAMLSLTNLKDKDNYTYTHSVNVAVLAMCLALRVGYSSDIEKIGVGALMHDIGKTQIPLSILRKPGPLNKGEAYVVKQHPMIGARILMESGGFNPVSILCTRDHHENMTGKGYPTGRRSNEICPHARITSIADVYDALTTDRPYRGALSAQQALTIMTGKLSESFDRDLLSCFISLIGYYPVGSVITLMNGYGAEVLENDPEDPSRPALVKTITYPNGKPVSKSVLIDLRQHKGMFVDTPVDSKVIEDAAPLVNREIQGFEAVA